MTQRPPLPETPHQLVSHHIHQLAKAAEAAHTHARTRTAAAYAEPAAPPVPQDGHRVSSAPDGGAA